ncbi:MAG: hypothetical protein WC732_01170 [Candidatus Omnitrophota bacterium]
MSKAVRSIFAAVMVAGAFLLLPPRGFAAETKELTLVFTGQSFAALYPCDCRPSDGGVARRASVIRSIRDSFPNALVVEAGSSVGSGPRDPNAQNEALDKTRSHLYLTSLSAMGYDAVLLDSQAFVFGENFLKEHDAPFVSSNDRRAGSPSVIKDFEGWKVGILGLTDSRNPLGPKEFQELSGSLQKQVDDLRAAGVKVIILLSAQAPEDDDSLLQSVRGIDIVVNGSPYLGTVKAYKLGEALFVQTWWQARNLAALRIQFEDGKIQNSQILMTPLGPEIADDPDISGLLPSCFSARDCRHVAGLSASCADGGVKEARCHYVALPKVTLTVIAPSDCRNCRVDAVLADLKDMWGEMSLIFLDENDPRAKSLIKDFAIEMLPAYIFHKDVEASEFFPNFKANLEEKNGYYRISPSIAGVSYIPGRPKIPGRLDVFYDMQYPQLKALFELLKEFSARHRDIRVELHFLAIWDKDKGILSLGSAADVEEFKRVTCAAAFYPEEKVMDYNICRQGQTEASWWDDCALKAKMQPAKIKACALSEEGLKLFKERIRLTEELKIASGPTFLVDNVEIFGIVNVPSLEEFEQTVTGQAAGAQKTKRKP